MFKLRYNILVAIQIILGLLNSALLLKVFGVSIQSDSYLLANSIIASLQGIQNLLIVQFIHFYNDEKVISKESANGFYNSALFFSFIVGFISFIMYHLFINQIIHIFALNIDYARFEMTHSLLVYSTLILIFFPVMSINEAILNAEMKFSIPYTLSFVPILCVVLSQVYLIIHHSQNIVLLAKAQALASVAVAIFGTFFISKTLIPLKFQLWHKSMPRFIKNSIEIAGGHAFYSVFFNIILNNFLISFSKGVISCYYYAKKVIDICTSFSIGPSRNILRSNISLNLAKKQYNKIVIYIKKYIKLSSIIIILVYACAFFLITPIIKLISDTITYNDIRLIKLIFLGLIPWSFIDTLGVPFAQFNIAAKKSLYLYVANISYLITMFVILFLLYKTFGIYAIIPATFFAAISCNTCHLSLFLHLFIKRKEQIC